MTGTGLLEFASRFSKTGTLRQLDGIHKYLVSTVAIGFVIFEIWAVGFVKLDLFVHRAVFVGWGFGVGFLSYSYTKDRDVRKIPFYDMILTLICLAAAIYWAAHGERIGQRWPLVDPLSMADLFFGMTTVLLALELTRRTVGLPLLTVTVCFLAYTFWGYLLPGPLAPRAMTFTAFIDKIVYTVDGLMGTPIAVAATYVFMFILFGTFLGFAGGGEFFYDLAKSLTGHSKGGPAKVAVISSGLYGTISGSPVSDVMATGTFTIPSMRKAGYSPIFAAAVETTASTGGSIMPPVMGSAAFLMAEFSGIPYLHIIKASLLPALLYYAGVFFQVHFRACTKRLGADEDMKVESVLSVLRKNFFYFVPLVALIWLLVEGLTPAYAALIATVIAWMISWARPKKRMGLRKTLVASVEAAKRSIILIAASAAAGVVIGGVMFTGLGGKFSYLVLSFAGGLPFPALIMTMVICIIMGMGIPTPAAYVITAALAVPAVLQLGFSAMTAHLFVVYFAVLSAITPPVASAAFAASVIAQVDPTKIAVQAVRLGIVAFLVPYMFVYQPTLLLQGTLSKIVITFITAFIGVAAVAGGIEGWFWRKTTFVERVCLILAGLLSLYPGFTSDLAGLAIIGTISCRQLKGQKLIQVKEWLSNISPK